MHRQTAQADVAASTEAVIRAWARSETFHWRRHKISYDAALQEFVRLNESTDSVFLFQFADEGVRLLDKPEILHQPSLQGRAEAYLGFFQQVIAQMPLAQSFVIALAVGDGPVNCAGAPTFSFQKRIGDPTILVNDVNMIEGDFYESFHFLDGVDFVQKDHKAIFVGATSGMHNSAESVRARTNPRIDAALYFKEIAEVDFKLPNIVQCEPEAEALIRAMDLGSEYISWQQQFNYKYLLSLDGNGAACQRIAVALKSKCAVLKYESDSLLYYFRGLLPWYHFAPISSHAEVVDLIELDRGDTVNLHEIADNGEAFFRDFLTRAPQILYFRNLLHEYSLIFR